MQLLGLLKGLQQTRPGPSAWAPLMIAPFGRMWTASLISNVGGFMQNIGAAWLLTAGSSSASWLGALQAASALPLFLFGLSAGVLADLQSRKKIILYAQVWMAATAFLLAYLAANDRLSPTLLLILTFCIGVGSAFHMPAWTAALPQFVAKETLPAAVTLSGVSVNLARAIGPALGGFVIALSSVSATFFWNGLTFILVFLVVLTWSEQKAELSEIPRERYASATKIAGSYVWRSPGIQAVMIRSFATLLCAAALWALLPLRARSGLGLGSSGLGLLMGCLGIGSVAGVFLLNLARKEAWSLDKILAYGALAFAGAMLVSALSSSLLVVGLALVLGGFGWIAIMATYNVCAQIAVASWIKARALALFLVVTQAALAVGGVLWGWLADQIALPAVFCIAALGLILQIGLARLFPLSWLTDRDMSPSQEFAAKPHTKQLKAEDGPIEIRIEYSIDPKKSDDFLQSLFELRIIRLRDGAYEWKVLWSPDEPPVYTESFLVSTWADHLRQHQRMTRVDEAIYHRVRAFQNTVHEPHLTHHVFLCPPVLKGAVPS